MITVNARIEKGHIQMALRTAIHKLVVDEPREMGGTDTGVSYSDLVAASLGGCTCVTLRMYADRKDWQLEAVSVEVTFDYDQEARSTRIRRYIHLTGDLSAEQRQRLPAVAGKCFIHNVLTQPIAIQTELAGQTAGPEGVNGPGCSFRPRVYFCHSS